jgi:metal-dependent amidase/aminoacylase/carboxypeptidase family protein
MVKKGVFDHMDFAIMMHMSNANVTYSGSLALDAYKFEFHGKPAHAASIPWEGRNALNAARLFLDSVDMMRQHVRDDVRLHGYIQNGGDASNIVPHYVSIEMLVRAKDRDYLNEVSAWVMDCAAGAALATRTSFTSSEIGEKYDGLKRNKVGEEILIGLYKELDLPLVDMSDKTGGSSDIGNVSQVIPAFHPYISIGEDLHAHTKEFALAMKTQRNYKAIQNGGEIIAKFIRDVYKSPETLDKIKAEFNNMN